MAVGVWGAVFLGFFCCEVMLGSYLVVFFGGEVLFGQFFSAAHVKIGSC